jgi:hypothetical protein
MDGTKPISLEQMRAFGAGGAVELRAQHRDELYASVERTLREVEYPRAGNSGQGPYQTVSEQADRIGPGPANATDRVLHREMFGACVAVSAAQVCDPLQRSTTCVCRPMWTTRMEH